jgi:hypothetical protein
MGPIELICVIHPLRHESPSFTALASSHSKLPHLNLLPLQTQNWQSHEGGRATPGKYVMPLPDRVICVTGGPRLVEIEAHTHRPQL